MTARLTWSEHDSVPVRSVKDLDREIDRLTSESARSRPIMVDLELDSGDDLAMGIGQPLSVLNFINASKDPPYFTSVGDPFAEGLIVFYYYGDWSEFPMRNAVPVDLARRAMRHFLQYGELLDIVDWEED